jgi:hypothetical protein
MHIEELEVKIEKWIRGLSYETKEIVLTELIVRMIQAEEVGWSEHRQVPYWESCGEELGENK